MDEEKITKIKKSINVIKDFLDEKAKEGSVEIVECNPFIMNDIIKYISYLENQVELNKFSAEDEDRMNILFIKGHYPELVKSLNKADGYDFGNKSWSCELIKPINKITSLRGTLYEIISALERIKEINSKGKKR